jgi:hypothetical protein
LKRWATRLSLIVLVALAFRLGFAWDYVRHLSHRALSTIPFLFESGNIAHSVATGAGFGSPFRVDTGPTAWMTPVYPLILAGIMKLFGTYTFPSYLAAVGLNIGWSALACVPLFYAGKRIGGVGVAATAAWLWAVFPNAILLSYESLWETSLSALIGATVLWATLRVAESDRMRDWCLYGLLWGLALMTNASLLSLLPLLMGWAAYRRLRQSGDWKRNAAMAAGLALLCCVPWTIRNYAVFHTFVPLRSVIGLQLWVGNNPQAKVVWLGEQHPIHDTAERERYIQMGEPAYMAEKRSNAIRYILTHPAREEELIGGRFIMLWAGGSPAPVRDFFANRSLWFRYVLLFNLLTACGALLGIIALVRLDSPFAFPTAVYPLVFPWAYYMTLAYPRYRHPIDPVIMLLTAVTLWQLTVWLRKTPVSRPRQEAESRLRGRKERDSGSARIPYKPRRSSGR